MKIEDGTGRGYESKVTKNNRLSVEAVTKTIEHEANANFGKAWALLVERTPSAGAAFFYFKNTGTTTYILDDMSMRVASAEIFSIYLLSTGTPAGGSTLTPVNLNTSSSNTMAATIQSANSITGLTPGNLIDKIYTSSTSSTNYNFGQDIIIAPGGVLTIRATTGSILVNLTLNMYEEVIE